jgi:hypothetical protein
MPSAPLQPTTLDAAFKTHGNETATSPSPRLRESMRSPMARSDLRTLKKILNDVQSPTPGASAVTRQQQHRSSLSIDASEDASSDTGINDEVQYTSQQHLYGDELEAGYENEDESMRLSDDAEGSALFDDEEREYVWSDGDTVEDIIATSAQTAPPARLQHLDGIYQHDYTTSDEIKDIKMQRTAIEEVVKQERINQELHAIDLSDSSELRGMPTTQTQNGLSRIEEDDELEVELEVRTT